MKKTNLPGTFGKAYFTGNESKYTTCYEYKSNNIRYVFDTKMAPFLTDTLHSAKILDVGCAFGTLLHFCDEIRLVTYGIDISDYALRRARKNTKAKLSKRDVNKRLPFAENFFDYVTALDIIEHVDSPYNLLLEIHRVLKKSGRLFIHTPNINSIFERLFGKRWFGYLDPTHRYLFNRKSLAHIVQKTGFTILVNETIFYPLPTRLRPLVSATDIGGTLWLVAQKI